MRRFLIVAASAVALTVWAGSTPASAGAATPAQVVAEGPMTKLDVEPVQYFARCRYWRAECSRRWGFRTWRYARCMRTRAC
ncbi:MAG: hypothetical protein RL291_2026 [Pseudomonadota bacterium]|jgi:hypothetical protein